ncbi:MAG: hypothetical protein CFE24_08220 [Flavobacterium sp. BFFFF2]|nr:MAG: hypothetical protein CFE24_08220 [Flavobacterium sp. BFFFF2]
MKIKYTLLLIFVGFALFAQNSSLCSKIAIDKDFAALPITSFNDPKSASIYFKDKDKENDLFILFNQELQIKDSIVVHPNKNARDLLGYSNLNGKTYLYFESKEDNQLVLEVIDKVNKSSHSQVMPFEWVKEKIIKRYSYRDCLYIFTLSKKQNDLNMYCFKGDAVTATKMPLKGVRFFNDSKQPTTMYELFQSATRYDLGFTCKTITTESLPPLTATVCKRKFYAFDTTFCFTFDNIPNFTQALFVNSEEGTLNQTTYMFPMMENEEGGATNIETNSLITKNYILQVKLANHQLLFVVKNWQNVEVNSYEINDNSEITFKNSDIIIEKEGTKNRKISTETKKLLQKMNQYLPAISCFEQNGKMYVSLGGAHKLQQNSGMATGAYFGLVGVLVGALLDGMSSSNSIQSYNEYHVVYINCLFDTQFKHIEGQAKTFAFDAMREFVDQNNSKMKVPVVFPFNDNLVLGALSPKTGNFCFQNFVNP